MKFGPDMLRELAAHHKKMCRREWCGTGMYIYFTEGKTIPISKWQVLHPAQEPTMIEKERGYVSTKGHIDQMDEKGMRVIGWHPTKEDLEAEDWIIIE